MMRLPVKNDPTDFDYDELNQMVDEFLEAGFNYFDTSYVYHNGKSQEAVRKALVERHPRESFKVATKFPTFNLVPEEKIDEVFESQLKDLGVEYVDYYLLHNLQNVYYDGIDGNGGIVKKTNLFEHAKKWKDEEKVNLVLSDLDISNDNTPCIYVKNADKVFVTVTNTNNLKVINTFTSDGETNTDAVIFSKDDLVINGAGTINITSTANGITSKDDLKITGSTINIICSEDALEANNSIAIAGGDITINSEKDGLHAEYSDDSSVGYIYISGGELNITAADDAVHATTIIQVDGGNITTTSREGLEATYIQINDGTINLNATDDGMNAGNKSNKYTTTIEINGGDITIDMGQGDTDAIDSNGKLYINGGTINITAQSPFDYDGEGELNGGEVTVNGSKIDELTNQMMGGGSGGRR